MKRIVLFMTLALFFTTALLLACGDQKEAQKPETAVTSADVKKEATEAMETAKAYTRQQKEEYQKKMEARLQELDSEIQQLQAKAQSSATELKEKSKAEFNQSMEDLRNKQQVATEKLNELKSASGQAWEDIKGGVNSAMDELGKAYDRARSHFKSSS